MQKNYLDFFQFLALVTHYASPVQPNVGSSAFSEAFRIG